MARLISRLRFVARSIVHPSGCEHERGLQLLSLKYFVFSVGICSAFVWLIDVRYAFWGLPFDRGILLQRCLAIWYVCMNVF